MQETESTWETYDLGCSAALVSVGFELIGLNKENPRKAQFIFRWKNNIQQVADDYWADRFEVNARSLFDNIKMLKNRLYS